MKLEKREITLNEADSLRDMYYLEILLQTTYENNAMKTERKDVFLALEKRAKQLSEESQKLKKSIDAL